ncbi:hypothetical protein KAJ27_21130 [bacterium]|nr:hypothetical protein [bacterium]
MTKIKIFIILIFVLNAMSFVYAESVGYGTELDFWVYDKTTKFYPYYQIKARCIEVGLHCYIFLHNDITTDYVDMDKITNFKEEFDYKIYPTTRKFYGPEPDPGLDGKDRIFILFYEMKYDDDITAWDKLGYYDSADRFADEIAYSIEPAGSYHSNEKEIIYLNGVDYDVNSSQIYVRTAELFEKLIHYDWMRRRDEFTQEPWIIEGLSTLNRFLNGYGHPDDIISYIIYPQLPLYIDSYDSFSSTSRGQIYMFFLYIYEKYGIEFIQKILQSPHTGEEVIREILDEKINNITLEELFGNWTVANYVDTLEQNDGLWGYENIDINLFPSQTFSKFPVNDQEGTQVYWGNSAMYQFSGGFGNKSIFVFSGETGSGNEIDKNDYKIYTVKKSREGKYTVLTTEVLPSQMMYYESNNFGTEVESLGFIIINNYEVGYGQNTFSFGRFGPEIASFNNPAIWHNILLYIRASKIPSLPECYVQYMNDPLKIKLPLEEIGDQLFSTSHYIDLKNPTHGEIVVSGTGYDGVWGINKIFFTYLDYLTRSYKETTIKGISLKSSTRSPALVLKKDDQSYSILTPGSLSLKISDPTGKSAIFIEKKDSIPVPVLYQKRIGESIEASIENSLSIKLRNDEKIPRLKKITDLGNGLIKLLIEDDTVVYPIDYDKYNIDYIDGAIELEIYDNTDEFIELVDMGGNRLKVKLKTVTDVDAVLYPNPVGYGGLLNIKLKFPTVRSGTVKLKLYSFNDEFLISEEDDFNLVQEHNFSFYPDDDYKNGTYYYKLLVNFSDGDDYSKTGKLVLLR